jgi:hypothetical protein
VIGPVKRTRAFNREHVRGALDDADRGLVTPFIGADRTESTDLSDVAASFAERELGLHVL